MKKSTTITLTLRSSDAQVGSNVHADGVLKGSKGISEAKISLKVILPNNEIVAPAGGSTTYTTSGGKFVIDYVPTVEGKHTFVATFSGNNNYAQSSNSKTFIPVEDEPAETTSSSSIRMELTSTSVETGKAIHADGLLSAKSGISAVNVKLKVTLPDGTTTSPVQGSSVTTDSEGGFDVDYTPTVDGSYSFTATFSGNKNYDASTAKSLFTAVTKTVVTKTATSLSLTPASSSIETGKNMQAEGLLKGSSAIAGAMVTLSVTLPDGTTTTPVQGASITTDSSGKFVMSYVPTMVGTYKFKAIFSGNSQYEGSSVSTSFTASAPATTSAYKFMVYPSGSTYYVKNAAGTVVSSSSNAATAIQYALNALTSGRTAKETVLLQGDFTLSKYITVPSYVTIKLDGKITMASNTNTWMLYASGKNNFDIIGGEWNGNQAGQKSGGTDRDGFWFQSCNYVTIKDLKIHDAPYDNIGCIDCDYVTVSNIESYNAGNYAKGSSWWGHGLMFSWCNYCVVENNNIHDCNSGGCYFYTENDGKAQTINNNVIRNNLIQRTMTSGIEVGCRGVEDTCSNNVIENNTCIDCGRDGEHAGVYLGWYDSSAIRYADHCTVRGNTVYETGNYYSTGGCGGGICVRGHYCTITDNVVYDTYDVGVEIRGNYNTLSYNKVSNVRNSAYAGMQIWDGNNNEVVYNTISGCSIGISVWIGITSGCKSNHIANNQFSDIKNYIVAIYDKGSTENIIENNTYVGKGSIKNSGTSTVVKNNTVAS